MDGEKQLCFIMELQNLSEIGGCISIIQAPAQVLIAQLKQTVIFPALIAESGYDCFTDGLSGAPKPQS